MTIERKRFVTYLQALSSSSVVVQLGQQRALDRLSPTSPEFAGRPVPTTIFATPESRPFCGRFPRFEQVAKIAGDFVLLGPLVQCLLHMTVKEVADYLHVSENHITNRVRKDEIPHKYVGGDPAATAASSRRR